MASSYINSKIDETYDSDKKWPMDLNNNPNSPTTAWENFDNTGGQLTVSVEKISSDVIRELRQHAKALEKNFDFAGEASGDPPRWDTSGDETLNDPSFDKIDDDETNNQYRAGNENLNETVFPNGANGGLLDGFQKMGILGSITGVEEGTKITKDKIEEIAQKIEDKSSYDNYSNYNRSGYDQYANYGQYFQFAYENYNNTHDYGYYRWMNYTRGYTRNNYNRYNVENDDFSTGYTNSAASGEINYPVNLANGWPEEGYIDPAHNPLNYNDGLYVNGYTGTGSEKIEANKNIAAHYEDSFDNPAIYHNNL